MDLSNVKLGDKFIPERSKLSSNSILRKPRIFQMLPPPLHTHTPYYAKFGLPKIHYLWNFSRLMTLIAEDLILEKFYLYRGL